MELTKKAKETKSSIELSLEPYFKEFDEQTKEWEEKALAIKVTKASQTDLMEGVRDARLALRRIRIGVEAKHKELKEDALRTGQTLDAIKRRLVGLIEPLESHLKEQEDFIAIREREAKEKLTAKRIALLEPFIGEQAKLMSLGDMDEAVFNTVLEGQKAAQEQRIQKEKAEAEEAERKATEARIEQERIRKENERVRRENERIQRISWLGLKFDDTQQSWVASHDGINISLSDLKTKSDSEFEEIIQSVLPLIEKETKRIKELERKAKQDEADRKAELAAQRKLKRAPDKEKLMSLASQIELLNCPPLKDEDAQKILNGATELLAKVVKYIKTNAEKL